MQVRVVLALLVATAGAAAAASGSVAFDEGFRLEGAAVFASDQGALDLAPAATRGEDLALRFARAEGELVTFRRETTGAPVAPWTQLTPTQREPYEARNGTFSGFACRPGCKALLVAEGAGAIGLAGHVAGPVAWADEERAHFFGYRARSQEDSVVLVVEPGWFQATGDPQAPASVTRVLDARPHAQGTLTLLLWNVTVTADAESGGGTLWTGARESKGPADAGALRTVTSTYARLRLDGADLAAPKGSHALVAAPRMDVRLDGVLDAPAATGAVVTERRHALDGEALRLEGRLEVLAASRAEASALPPPPARLDARAWAAEATFRGDLDALAIGGRVVEDARAPSVATTISLLALAAILVGALARLALGGLAPLYTRISRDGILRNANRRRIFDAIQRAPSVTLAEIQRDLGLTQVVVRHHVRVLEGLGLVRAVQEGRRRSLFAVGGPVAPSDGRALVVLKDGTRKRIAETLGRSGPMTQRDLVEATGCSQRLVSYHLDRLEKARLVVVEGATPQQYAATPLLVGTLARAAAPRQGAGAS